MTIVDSFLKKNADLKRIRIIEQEVQQTFELLESQRMFSKIGFQH